MKLSIIALSFLALPVTAFCSMESIYAEQNGTCTKDTCLKGEEVKVFESDGDSGYAQSSNGDAMALHRLKSLDFKVDGQDEKCSECAMVISPGGERYSIQRMFLKKSG